MTRHGPGSEPVAHQPSRFIRRHPATRLVKQTAPQLVARHGIGTQSAAQLLITAGDNPERHSWPMEFEVLEFRGVPDGVDVVDDPIDHLQGERGHDPISEDDDESGFTVDVSAHEADRSAVEG